MKNRGCLEIVREAKSKVLDIQRFTIPFKLVTVLPLILWFSMFNLSKYIPKSARPKIDTHTLPYLDSIILDRYTLLQWPRSVLAPGGLREFLDMFFAIAYIIHFAFAWIYALCLYFYYRKKTNVLGRPIPQPWTFLFCFGLLNATAVFTQLVWPTAPPWYVDIYGGKPPEYGMEGDPAGLANADQILTISLFKSLYGQSPVVFGSFPSLHGAWPLMMALFVPGRRLKIVFALYGAWVWWAAMYLNHHYLVDLLGGGLYVVLGYAIGKGLLKLFYASKWKDSIYHKFEQIYLDIEKDSEHVELVIKT